MGEFICRIFAWPLVKFYEATGSYGLAIVVFALMVNLIMTPFMAKSKKSMMRSSRRSCSAGMRATSRSSTPRCRSSTRRRASTRCPAACGR